uniref:Uncharacterized protein n=1 Tax=Arundo donax TaxID=35708 RepID=A0A0A8XXE8_ARUDO
MIFECSYLVIDTVNDKEDTWQSFVQKSILI